jgi:hypothetical protein
MFSQDDVSAGHLSANVSRSSIKSQTKRASFKNPYMDIEKVTPVTNNTSGIKSAQYTSGVKHNNGIKTYEQTIQVQGSKDEPIYPQINLFEDNAGISNHFS